jgi:hypothetical protein
LMWLDVCISQFRTRKVSIEITVIAKGTQIVSCHQFERQRHSRRSPKGFF